VTDQQREQLRALVTQALTQAKDAESYRNALREILMEATSRNHALDIARRALHADKLQK
jgi:hypothetical protein